jgi:hypothetical protein
LSCARSAGGSESEILTKSKTFFPTALQGVGAHAATRAKAEMGRVGVVCVSCQKGSSRTRVGLLYSHPHGRVSAMARETTAVRVITPLSQRPPLPSDHPPTTHPPTPPHTQALPNRPHCTPQQVSLSSVCVCDTLSFSSRHHAASQAIHRSRWDEHNNRAHSTAAPCPIGRPALVDSFLTQHLPALPTHAFCLSLSLSATHKCCCCVDVAVVKGRAGPQRKLLP